MISEKHKQCCASWHSLELPDVFDRLQSCPDGLQEEEATLRLEKFGHNKLIESKKVSMINLFINQFNNYLIIILLIAILLSAMVGEYIDAFVIFIIVFFAAGLGFVQEYRTEKAIDKLKEMTAPTTTVIRNGKQIIIPSELLVPGDIIPIVMGDKVPADARLIESINLQTNESSLTGESIGIDKECNTKIKANEFIGNRFNMIYTGTIVTFGRGKAIVVSTGMNTEFGNIAGLLESVEISQTPLQRNLDQLGKTIAKITFAVIGVVFVVGVLRGFNPLDMFIWAIALAIAVVPEALPAVVTISLAIGVQKMSKRNSLIRKLPAVETLGATSIICSDKTGTLTTGEMRVTELYCSNRVLQFGTKNSTNIIFKSKELDLLLLGSTLCNDTKIEYESNVSKFLGTPTEIALKDFASHLNYEENKIVEFPRIDEIPFTSERKMMTTVHHSTTNQVIVFSKGAPEIILQKCTSLMIKDQLIHLTDQLRSDLQQITENMARKSLRTIAIAYKSISDIYSKNSLEIDLIFLGFLGLRDPPREGVKSAVEECKKAGIKTVMITGDHVTTALAVAKELNISSDGVTLTGIDLDAMTDQQLDHYINDVEVFARVAPNHKLRVVESLTRAGHIVAMTGDGINDAPALKRANVGIAMGIKGTDVTKEAADMILTDDNFVSIVGAVEEGRIMFSNIKKYLMYLLSSNLGEILLLGLSVMLGLPLPLIAIQILYVNLATDGLPALALAVEPPEGDYMLQQPRNTHKSIFSRSVVFLMTLGGVWSATINLSIFLYLTEVAKIPLIEAQSIVFASLIIIQFCKAFNYRSDHQSITKYGIFSNKWLNLAIFWEFTLLIIIIYTPFLQIAFGTYGFGIFEWVLVLVSALSVIPILEFGKYFVRRQMMHEPLPEWP